MSKNEIIFLVKGVLSSAIGVQNDENRRKAFEQGSMTRYVIAGAIFTVLFVACLILLVSIVL